MINKIKFILDDILAAAGALSITVGAFLFNQAVGFVVMGVLLIAAAYLYSAGKGGELP